MKTHTVFAKSWGSKEIIPSPVEGKVTNMNVQKGDEIYGTHPVTIIQKKNGEKEQILAKAYGKIESLNVELKQNIVRGEVLIIIQ